MSYGVKISQDHNYLLKLSVLEKLPRRTNRKDYKTEKLAAGGELIITAAIQPSPSI